jgi:hypothetical protein
VLHTLATTHRAPMHGPGEQAVYDAMQAFHFDMMGSNRTVWDFYRGYELSITVIFATLAVLMWQCGNLSRSESRHALPIAVTLLACEILLCIVSWAYFFAGPGTMSALIIVCIGVALLAMARGPQAASVANDSARMIA